MKRIICAVILPLLISLTASCSVTEHDAVSIVLAGDILLDRGVESKIKQMGVKYPFSGIKDILSGADIAFANLECPITSRGTPVLKRPEITFRTGEEVVPAIKDAGFDILNLANNHTMDFGREGLQDTIDYLERAGISTVGAGDDKKNARRPVYLEVSGITIGFLGYSAFPSEGYFYFEDRPDVAQLDEMSLQGEVNTAKKKCDFLIVSFHWGAEYDFFAGEKQKRAACIAIEGGADAVVGHHPHVLQGIEMYKGKPVFYSLGNFVFDRQINSGTDETIIAKLRIKNRKLEEIELIPLKIEDCRPRLALGKEAENILKRLQNYSKDLNSNIITSGEKGYVKIQNEK